jgi:hypothetical protein
MIYYFAFCILASSLLFITQNGAKYFALIGFMISLILLPSTGADYDYYKSAYDSASLSSTFPYFNSLSELTAEPLYLWYSSVISVVTSLPFNYFLAVNFGICIAIFGLIKKGFIRSIESYFWIALLPVVLPTIFYASPRSSISFILCLSGVVLLAQKQAKLGFSLLFLGISFHSQYIPAASIAALASIVMSSKSQLSKIASLCIHLTITILAILLLASPQIFGSIASTVLAILPSGDVAVAKLHYLEGTGDSLRMTSLLSIAVYPILFFQLNRISNSKRVIFEDKELDANFLYLLGKLIFFGAIINLIYFDNPHIAGRLSRLSDYLGIGILIPAYLKARCSKQLVAAFLMLFALVSPILYRSLYVF